MRFIFPWWRRKKVHDAIKAAEQERKLSEKNLRESEPLLESLREMRRRNHVGDLINELIQHRVEKELRG